MSLDTMSPATTSLGNSAGSSAEASRIGTEFSNAGSESTGYSSTSYSSSGYADFQQSAQIIIAGWYPDPADVDSLRWWDGSTWTAAVKERRPITAPTPVVRPASPTTAFPPVAIRTEAALPPIDPYRPKNEREHDTYVPMASATTGLTFAPTHKYTTSVWWLATLPVWSNVIGVVLIVGLEELFTPFLQLFSGVILLLIVIALIVRDRKQLLADNHSRPASVMWFLLSPLAYLIARSMHIHRSLGGGWAPTVLFLVGCVVPAAVIVGMDYLQTLMVSLGF